MSIGFFFFVYYFITSKLLNSLFRYNSNNKGSTNLSYEPESDTSNNLSRENTTVSCEQYYSKIKNPLKRKISYILLLRIDSFICKPYNSIDRTFILIFLVIIAEVKKKKNCLKKKGAIFTMNIAKNLNEILNVTFTVNMKRPA